MARAGNKLVQCVLCGQKHRWPGEDVEKLHDDTKYRVWESRKAGIVTKWGKAGEFVCRSHKALAVKTKAEVL